MVVSKEGKTQNIEIENFVYVPEVTDYLFSGTYALQKGLHVREGEKTMVLFKERITIKFYRIVKKGSSFIMCLKILPNKSERVNITEETNVESVGKNTISDIATKSKKTNEILLHAVLYLEYHGKLGH